jgi:TolA-binding protein
MNKMTLAIVCLFFAAGTGGHAVAQRGGGGGGRQSPMAKLMNDLQQATPRATLTDDQNTKLQTDIATVKDAQQARRQGQSVDQDKVQSAFDDIHGIVDSGAFQQADQKQLDQDITAIQPPQQ